MHAVALENSNEALIDFTYKAGALINESRVKLYPGRAIAKHSIGVVGIPDATYTNQDVLRAIDPRSPRRKRGIGGLAK